MTEERVQKVQGMKYTTKNAEKHAEEIFGGRENNKQTKQVKRI